MFDFFMSAAIWAEDMGDKAERRRKREASVRALNGVAEAVGLEAINVRANNEESQPVFMPPGNEQQAPRRFKFSAESKVA